MVHVRHVALCLEKSEHVTSVAFKQLSVILKIKVNIPYTGFPINWLS